MRIDVFLHQSGIAPSRQKAQELIEKGKIFFDGHAVTKPSFSVEESDACRIELRGDGLKYVSRGGEKLEAALDAFQIDVDGMIAVDLGASTGGFTDCLLQRGAKKVFCVDCGTDQLHPKLQADARVCKMEQCNARYLRKEALGTQCDLAVMDVSFISQTQLYDTVVDLVKTGGIFLSLIKPQFEAGRSALTKKGIVKEERDRRRVIETIELAASAKGLACKGVIPSPIRGGDGNIEYLAYFIKEC